MPFSRGKLTAAQVPDLSGTYARTGEGFRPLRAACIGTSIYANGLRSVDNITVQIGNTWGPMDATGMQQCGPASWFTWLCLLSGGRIIHHYNGGISSDQLPNMVSRFQTDVVAKNPDIVFLGDATNDINNAATDASIRGNVDTMVKAARAAGITPILTATIHRNDDTTKNQRVREHNAWQQRYAAANRIFYIDPFATLIDPASTTGNTLASMTSDGLHPNHIGGKAAGQKALADMAGFLRGNTDLSKTPWVSQHRAQSPNLLFNSLFQDDVNADGIADSWSATGNTKTVTTDAAVLGKLQRVDITSATGNTYQQLSVDGTNIRVGDRLAFSGLAKVDASAGSLQWQLGLAIVGMSYGAFPMGYSGGGAVGTDLPWSPFYCELVIPSGAPSIRGGLWSTAGTGSLYLAQCRLLNLTKLGTDTIR